MAVERSPGAIGLILRIDVQHYSRDVAPVSTNRIRVEQAQIRNDVLLVVNGQYGIGGRGIGDIRIKRRLLHGRPRSMSRTERMSSTLANGHPQVGCKVGNEWGRRDWYDLPTVLARIDVDEWVQSEPGQLANFDSGAPAVFAGRRTLCPHLGHTNQRHF